MALTNSKKFFQTEVKNIEEITSYFVERFEGKGYTVSTEPTADGKFISITKSGFFRSISGLKTGLNVTLKQKADGIEASLEVGIFGKQLIPTAISMLVLWPVLISQIIGLVQQNNLDKEAYQTIEEGIKACENQPVSKSMAGNYCPFCGKSMPDGSVFCPSCGKKIGDNNTCSSCGTVLPEGAAFCPKCGAKTE